MTVTYLQGRDWVLAQHLQLDCYTRSMVCVARSGRRYRGKGQQGHCAALMSPGRALPGLLLYFATHSTPAVPSGGNLGVPMFENHPIQKR